MLIESSKNQKIKDILKLREGRTRRKRDRFILEGDREVLRAIRSGIEITELFICEELVREEVKYIFKETSVEPIFVTSKVFDKMALRETSGGVIASAIPKYHDLSILEGISCPFVLAVEAVEKPGNLGAILRTADGSGADLVVVLDEATDIYNPNCIRASLGGVFSVPVARSSIRDFVEYCQTSLIQVLAASPDADNVYHQSDLTHPTALVFGSEAFGLSPQWRGLANLVNIPMLGVCDSLNVSVSAAILSYELRRQRTYHNQ